MATFYLDTSALVKRYDAKETGAAWVQSLFVNPSAHLYLLSEVTMVELHSALYRKLREGRITGPDLQTMLATIQRDVTSTYWLEPANRPVLEAATDLIRKHPLRAYDAIQLATALHLNRELQYQSNLSLLFLSADDRLVQVASIESLAADNPNQHP